MTTQPNGEAPSVGRYKMGARGGSTYLALQDVWDKLSATEYQDALGLADVAAVEHEVDPASVRSYIYALAREGMLERSETPIEFSIDVVRGEQNFQAKRSRPTFKIVR